MCDHDVNLRESSVKWSKILNVYNFVNVFVGLILKCTCKNSNNSKNKEI